MPFTRTKPLARCTEPGHGGSRVVANGPYTRGTAIYQCYRCTPPVGDVHRFSVRLDGGAPVRNQPGAPDCAAHPGSSVVRNGRHGKKGGLRRQRYRCRHERCNDTCLATCRGRHDFTPPLPRAHVCVGDACAVCREPTPIHRGRTAAARRSRIAPDVAAKALSDMSLRVSYAKAGKEALEAMDFDLTVRRRQPSATPPKPRRRWSRRKKRARSASTRMWGRFWQVAAAILEAHGPVVWAAAEERLRERAAGIVALGERRVWILDEIPIYALAANGKRKKSDGWVVLVVAEMDWTDKQAPGRTRLRLVRAMPKANATAWRLVFSEVGYTPDIIVSDAATSIVAAVGRHFEHAPTPPLFVPSLWHLGRALENNALEKALTGPNGRDLRIHLNELKREGGAIRSVGDWIGWWDHLRALARASGRVKMDSLRQTRANYEARMAAAIPTLLADLNAVAGLITADTLEHDGWTVPLRTIADPLPAYGAYRSLRDEMLLLAVAEQRGIAV